MVRWLLDKDPRSYTKTLRGKVHNRVVYQIMMWPLGGFAFTISMDRRIIAWDMDTNQGVAHIECIGGNVYALEANPLDPGRIAVGLGNETIKVWNTLSKDEPYECVTVERLQTKVRAVKWHPIEEETLCFGLENGKIGMIKNILGGTSHHYQQQQQRQGKKAKQGSKSKDKMGHVQVVFQSYHEGAVVSMSWCTPKAFEAPVPELFDLSLRDSAVCVISIGSEGKILVTDTSKPASRSLDLESVIQRQNVAWYESRRAIKGGDTPPRRDFALHPNEDLLAIGNDDGSVEIFELQYFKLVYVFQGHRRRVNRLKWSWSGAAVSDESDERDVASYLLASGSDDGALAIHDLRQFSAKAHAEKRQRDKQLMADREEQGSSAADTEGISSTSFFLAANAGTVLPTARAYAYFSYHSRGIADLAWSPHGSWEASDTATFQKLVAVSFDGKAIVYQVQVDSGDDDTLSVPRQHTALACYDRHEGQILSVLWSMSDIDQIYTGGNDWRISVWNWKSFKLSEPQVDALKRSGGSSSFQVEGKGTAAKSLLPAVKPQAVPETKAGLHQSNQGHLELERNHQGRIKQVNQASSEIPLDETQRGPMAAEDAVETVSTKRVGETVLQSEIVSSKKARTQSNKLVSTLPPVAMATLKGVDLFPLSSENFQYRLRKQVHLEIIRLTRNLYCRRFGHGGFLTRDEDIVAARGRWRQMRQFFESDGEEEALTLSRILGQDIDEMNLDDDVEEVEQGEPFTPEQRMEQVRPGDGTKPSENKIPITLDASQRGMEQEEQRLPDEEDLHEKEVICTEEDSVADTGAGNPGGDLVFYGSRESIKALAEMEAQQVSKIHAGSSAQLQHHSNIFSVGGGMGVVVAPNYGQRDTASLTKSKKTAHLGQVPISYWMGDVPKMMDILSVLPDSTLGTHDWIGLALSPMGGVEAWRTMMSRTAIKCESAGETHAAVLCHLGIGRVYEAVDAYRKKEMYREALMLLRIRLWDDEDFDEPSESDGQADLLGHKNSDTAQNTEGQRFLLSNRQLSMLHVQILTEWGQYLERRNRFEQACKCQLTLAALLIKGSSVLGNQTVLQSTPSVALQTLARRGDVATLRIVAGLAILLDDPFRQERIQQYEVLQTRLKSNSLLPKN
ncbi:Gem-associated protein 5 [Mortierella claussenii]|nr:Gem-associated protein 5 [Mortierella claussenii]